MTRAWWLMALILGVGLALAAGQRPSLSPESAASGASASGAREGAASRSSEGRVAADPDEPTREPPSDRREPAAGAPPALLAALPPELGPLPSLWQLDEGASFLFDHPVGDYRPARFGLRLDPEAILALEVGDNFTIPLPGIGEVEGTVSWVNEHANGDRGVGAVMDGSDDEYALTLTLGERALFAQVATAQGRFLVEGVGGAAAVFYDDLEQVLVDPTRTDERVPPEVSG